MPRSDNPDALGLGPHLVGRQLDVNGRNVAILKQLGEGGFSFVYLVGDKDNSHNSGDRDGDADDAPNKPQHIQQPRRGTPTPPHGTPMVLKITSVHNITQRRIAEKEASLLRKLSHPSIVQVYDDGFRDPSQQNNNILDDNGVALSQLSSNAASLGGSIITNNHHPNEFKSIQHLILLEYCEGGNAFEAIKRMKASHEQRFDLPSLVISFGQICNAVSYLHAQRPPLIHRDLKPVNFLIKNGAYKLCDFGSAVVGHTDLRTPENRRHAEEVVNKTTTQMFRAPEMVDLYMAKRLTQSTDVWALGCCLYSLAFLRDCFEEGSNLAILSRKYKIPEDNPYGDGIVELIDRMLTVDYKDRADMSEVIMCLSALYSGRPLPKRKKRSTKPKEDERNDGIKESKIGAYRTDGQGIRKNKPTIEKKKVVEAKKLDPKSAAAKRKKASEGNKLKEVPSTRSESASSQMSGQMSGNSSHGRLSVDSRMSSPPNSVNGDFENFAAFDQVFSGNNSFDPFHDGSGDGFDVANEPAFSSNFNEQCQISAVDSSHNSALHPESFDAFDDAYKGFGTVSPSFSSKSTEDKAPLTGTKAKRNFFGRMGKKVPKNDRGT
jgi:serine/threonine protein kinase